VEADVRLDDGSIGRAAVPSGASTVSTRRLSCGRRKIALSGQRNAQGAQHINVEIAHGHQRMDAARQAEIDRKMIEIDGTPNKGRLGANAILAVSMANARAAAMSKKMPLYRFLGGDSACLLPLPMMNNPERRAHADTRWTSRNS